MRRFPPAAPDAASACIGYGVPADGRVRDGDERSEHELRRRSRGRGFDLDCRRRQPRGPGRQLRLRENLGGRSVLNAAGHGDVFDLRQRGGRYFQSDRRFVRHPGWQSSKEDVVFQINACDRRVQSQEIVITDPGGGENTVWPGGAGRGGSAVSPSSGVNARRECGYLSIRLVFQTQKGTATIPVYLSNRRGCERNSRRYAGDIGDQCSAQIIRVLVNNHDGDQRWGGSGGRREAGGHSARSPATVGITFCGRIRISFWCSTPRPTRRRARFAQATPPTQMAITRDGKYLLVGHGLGAVPSRSSTSTRCKPISQVIMPFGHYPRFRSLCPAGLSWWPREWPDRGT